jgi:hypothetical protein
MGVRLNPLHPFLFSGYVNEKYDNSSKSDGKIYLSKTNIDFAIPYCLYEPVRFPYYAYFYWRRFTVGQYSRKSVRSP